MATHSLQYGPEEHLEDLAFLIARLKADPDTVSVVPDVEPAYSALKAQTDAWSLKRHAVTDAQAAVESADKFMDNAVRTAHDIILDDVKHAHRDPKFITYFPRGLTAIIKVPYSEEAVAVGALADRCSQDPSPKVRELAGPLGSAAVQMRTSLDLRDLAVTAEASAYGQLQVQKIAAIDTIRRAVNRLEDIFPHERDKVRTFTRPIRRPERPKEDQPPLPTAPAPTPQA